MKTQLIPLESHDDLISVRDRMSWAKTPRILLVWPKSERIRLRQLDLKVLQRHAVSLGAQLGLVVRHRKIRREAEAIGIPVFNTTGEAQRNPWPERRIRQKRERHSRRPDMRKRREQFQIREGAWRNLPVIRVGVFLLGVMAVLALAAIFIPRAQINLSPEIEVQTATLPIQADPNIKTVFITGKIPSRTLRVEVDGDLEKRVTGRVPVPQTKAQGIVTFRALTEDAVTIPAGTVLTSIGLPGVRFLTLVRGELPGELKETLDIPIEAANPGAEGNVDAETILAIEGNLGLLATVTNAEPTSGGTDRMTNAATETDLAHLRTSLIKALEEQALEEMESLLAPGDQIFLDTLMVEQIIKENYDPPPGQASTQISLNLQAEFSASFASGEDLAELANTVLNASLPDEFISSGIPMTFELLNSPKTDEKGVTSWSMYVTREVQKHIDAWQVIVLVQGRSMEIALRVLENNLDFQNTPEIQLEPDWWPWLPLIPYNIRVGTQ